MLKIFYTLLLLFPSVTPTIRLTPKLESDYEGHSVVLECSGGVNPMKTAAQLAYADRINVEWFGPDGNPLTGKTFIGDRRNSDAGTTHTLTIVETTFRHSGLYSCQVTLDLPNTDFETSHRVTTQYHLVLLSKFLIPCRGIGSSSTASIIHYGFCHTSLT